MYRCKVGVTLETIAGVVVHGALYCFGYPFSQRRKTMTSEPSTLVFQAIGKVVHVVDLSW